MSFKAITIGAALFIAAGPVAAQQRGTVELGAFGSAGFFDKDLTLNHGMGGGGHVGVFLDPRLAIEFEKGEMRASRTLGLHDVNVGILVARLVATPVKIGGLSLMIGAGAGAGTETYFMHSYGVNALVGAKLRLTNSVALRVDGISDWLANNDWRTYQTVHVGLSFTRNPRRLVREVVRTVEIPGPVVAQRPDSVTAEEQARRRSFERMYRDLRDSLSRVPAIPTPVPVPASSAADLSAMEEKIHFATDKYNLNPEARAILDAKVSVFVANPAMRIVIVGNTDERASDAYNMALGGRRSSAAKDYLVARGIDGFRIEITTAGERNPTASGTSRTAQGLNRRAEFRLVIATEPARPPKR